MVRDRSICRWGGHCSAQPRISQSEPVAQKGFQIRRDRLRLLSRMNRGRTEAPSFLLSLSRIISEPVEAEALVSLPETDALREAFRVGYQSLRKEGTVGYRRLFSLSQSKRVFQLADCFADQIANERAFLLTRLSEYCGAVNLSLSSLVRHTASVIQFDGDSLSALSIDRIEGILIDHNAGDLEHAYEVAVWGERWPLLVLGCDHGV